MVESLYPAGSLPSNRRSGLALYTGRNFEQPVISHSVLPKIDHRKKQIKKNGLFSVHN
jgi:hypothetical protein